MGSWDRIINYELFGRPVRDHMILLGGQLIKILVIVILAVLILKVSSAFIDRVVLAGDSRNGIRRRERRVKTLGPLLKSMTKYVVWFFAFTMILRIFKVEIGALIATAGLAGFALGFGAQNLIRDVITGFFIFFEDQFAVGDYVSVAGVSGIVEEMELRATKIRDFAGQLYIIPNGQITQVTNFMGSSMRVMFDVGIAYGANVSKAIEVLTKAFEDAAGLLSDVKEGPTVLGVQDLGESAVLLRVLARTEAMKQWDVERSLKRIVKEALDSAGIEFPPLALKPSKGTAKAVSEQTNQVVS